MSNALNPNVNSNMITNPSLPPNMNEHSGYLSQISGLNLGMHPGHHQMMNMGPSQQFQPSQVQQFPGQMQAQQGEYSFSQMMPPNLQPGMFYPPDFSLSQAPNNNIIGKLNRIVVKFFER